MKTETWLLLTNIATLITSVAALVAILEMRRQRKASYKPDIVINQIPFRIVKTSDSVFPKMFTSNNDNPNQQASSKSAMLECVNVGFGPAKHVRFKWIFDVQSIIEKIAALHLESTEIWNDERMVSISISDSETFHHVAVQFEGFVTSHMPALATIGQFIPLPPVFQDLSLIYLEGQIENNVKQGMKAFSTDLPTIRLTLDYRDLENNRHQKAFEISLSIRTFATLDDQTATLIQSGEGVINVSET